MKICIVGPGAIGGSIAQRFAAHSGQDVSVLARGAALEAIRRNGVTLICRGRRDTVPVRAAAAPAELGPQDVVVLALKAYSLAAVAPTLTPMLTPQTVVVPVQNGVPWWYFYMEGGRLDGSRLDAIDPDGAIERALPSRQAIGAVTYAGARVPEPGVVDLTLDELMLFGEPDGSSSPRLAEIVGLFERVGFKCQATPAIRKAIWLKLWGNATMNPVSVLANTTIDRLITDPAVKATLSAAMLEVRAVAGALGMTFDFTLEQRFAQAADLGAFKTSMLQDLEAGRALEIEALVGVVVELAHKLDVKVPVMETIYALTRLRGLR
ncbi:MAG: 2-dehydropantoate 2-reductase [Proteobacteria bacterium]|nr:2-dehydropantoate 2-reductase [Pseudomonadota bacterium]